MNTLDKLRLDVLISEVRKIASERPDVVSDSKTCMYESGVCSDGSVGCLFGQGFAAMDWKPYTTGVRMGIQGVFDVFYGENEKLDWCSDVQDNQDGGMSWAKSVKSADEQNEI